MSYKFIKILIFLVLFSCVNKPQDKHIISLNQKSFFLNKGFALIYEEDLFKKKIINDRIEDRSLIIFQKNLKKDTTVKITNLLNSKYIIVKVGNRTIYPYFFNSVVSKRISLELELDKFEPYIEIKEVAEGTSFIAKKAKTFDEEKKVAIKVPVDDILIKNIGKKIIKETETKKKKFNYTIKIADFYFKKSASQMKSRIINETSVKNVNIEKLSDTKFRVFLGPFSNLNSLKNSFNAINVLQFDNLEIIKK